MSSGGSVVAPVMMVVSRLTKSGLGQMMETWTSGSAENILGSKDSTTPRMVTSGNSSEKNRYVDQYSGMKYRYNSCLKEVMVWSAQFGFSPRVSTIFRFPVLEP